MKQYLITLLAVGVLASAAEAEARLVSTKGQCVAACGQAVSDSCGWITKRGKFNRCRVKLINKCKRFGTNVMCPATVAPPPPSSPTGPTTPTTTLPAPPPPTTTTTTVPYIPPTTTTLPLPPPPADPLGQFSGTTWDFVYTLVSTWDDVYYFTFTFGFTSTGQPYLIGVDQYGNADVQLGQAAPYGIPYDYLLADPGPDLCEAFAFDITGPTQVDGVVFYFYPDCSTLMGGPYPFIGYMR